ncbi:hypothetical protein [Flavobacterium subsaxonicum]|uniref:Outer membrane protein beta-barrel domain-containing protein n=1 Tax=Flavobacterium subsaxonicum WB 4.1-42 = DSM 21790 TaxID=1121898 RepID=A0A0A2MRU6_9FLAO|nr:hypothetical protein [Flavobacterium subsaxonicum]KGO95064.1 hypothetical protein Q766_02860 [Flavobacterium subsaxonicum WB 4.1-42 = DSM 21790]
MKKLLLISLILTLFSFTAHAQQGGFRAGVHAGLPLSDASDISSVNLGADVNYLFNVTDRVALGASTGYSAFLGKDDFDTYSYIPVAFSGRASYGANIFYAADVGYAIALDSYTDGGLLYQAKLGYTNNFLDAFVFYKGISADGATIAAVGLGVGFKL